MSTACGISNTKLNNNIAIKDLKGDTLIFESIRLDDTGLVLKEAYSQRTGIPVDQLRMIFNGREVEDQRTLASYGVEYGALLYRVLKLRGGGIDGIVPIGSLPVPGDSSSEDENESIF